MNQGKKKGVKMAILIGATIVGIHGIVFGNYTNYLFSFGILFGAIAVIAADSYL